MGFHTHFHISSLDPLPEAPSTRRVQYPAPTAPSSPLTLEEAGNPASISQQACAHLISGGKEHRDSQGCDLGPLRSTAYPLYHFASETFAHLHPRWMVCLDTPSPSSQSPTHLISPSYQSVFHIEYPRSTCQVIPRGNHLNSYSCLLFFNWCPQTLSSSVQINCLPIVCPGILLPVLHPTMNKFQENGSSHLTKVIVVSFILNYFVSNCPKP